MKISTRILRWFYKLSWKKTLAMGMFLLVIAVVPISLRVATNPTRTRSEAALIQPQPASITKKFEVPKGPPEIYLVDHFFGKEGDAVLIHGKNLGGVNEKSYVTLSGKKIDQADLVSWTGSYIEFKVPTGAKSGQVGVSVLGKRTDWPGMFFVTNEATKAELKLEPAAEKNQAQLKAEGIEGEKELLVWLLIINGDGNLVIQPKNGLLIKQKIYEFPVGKVYEVKIALNKKVGQESLLRPVSLLLITKGDEKQLIGIARGELSNARGELRGLKVNPLYVSF